jgi:hypothetical protein
MFRLKADYRSESQSNIPQAVVDLESSLKFEMHSYTANSVGDLLASLPNRFELWQTCYNLLGSS